MGKGIKVKMMFPRLRSSQLARCATGPGPAARNVPSSQGEAGVGEAEEGGMKIDWLVGGNEKRQQEKERSYRSFQGRERGNGRKRK